MKKRYWDVQELVLVGIIAATSKIATLVVTLLSGGMNPLGLIAKNIIFTTMLMILVARVPKAGVILLFTCVTTVVNILFLGGSITILPAMLLAGMCAEAVAIVCGGYTKGSVVVITVLVFDIVSKLTSIGISWLVLRENPVLLSVIIPVIIVGYVGSIIGIFTGVSSIRELKHAGIIK